MRASGVWVGLAAAIFLTLWTGSAWAQNKPRGCLTSNEHVAEREVRHGVRLREMSFRCDQQYPREKPIFPRWKEFSEKFAAQFVKQVDARRKAMAREFPGNFEEVMKYWDDRLVVFFRHYPLTEPYCQGISKLFDPLERSGWNAFVKQAAAARDEIMLWDYKLCR